MFDDATIVAIATANGIGSISIVRISGVNALEIATKISKKTTFQPRLATLSYLYDFYLFYATNLSSIRGILLSTS